MEFKFKFKSVLSTQIKNSPPFSALVRLELNGSYLVLLEEMGVKLEGRALGCVLWAVGESVAVGWAGVAGWPAG